MLTPPTELDYEALAETLGHWGLHEPRLEYLPVGFGSHHWRAGEAFVTVDELAAMTFEALDRAYRTAGALRDAGLGFVLAPLPDDTGAPTCRLGERFAVSVTPFVEGKSSSFGSYETKAERRQTAALVGRVHVAGERLPAGLTGRDDLEIPVRPVLEEALASLAQPWTTGPFAEPARALLAARASELQRVAARPRCPRRAAAGAFGRLGRHPWRAAPRQPDHRRGRRSVPRRLGHGSRRAARARPLARSRRRADGLGGVRRNRRRHRARHRGARALPARVGSRRDRSLRRRVPPPARGGREHRRVVRAPPRVPRRLAGAAAGRPNRCREDEPPQSKPGCCPPRERSRPSRRRR